jgi:nicotinamide-nucleotide amidase
MKLEMICTGEEVLAGQIVDTNAAWFADTMMNHGIELQRRVTVGDRMQDLIDIFTECSQRADVILVNGGLGPTSDDLSAEAAALALGEDLQEDTQWRQHLQDWYREQGREFPKSNLKQCLLPTSAVRIDNPKGTAPGFRIKLNQAWLFFTPGVPVEFKTMVEEQFIPFLQQEFTSTQSTRLHKLLTLGHGESVLADKLTALTFPPNITLGYRPSAPHVEIKVFARGEQAIGQLNDFVDAIKSLLGIAIVTENCPSIAQCVHELLLQNHCTLSLAESCTGGMLSSQMVEFAGSSNYLHQSLVTYSNQSKQQILGIPEASLAEHGSVSLETAIAMAESVRGLANSDYALAISGIAGPDGGSEEKPVGTVCLAIADRKGSRAQMIHLPYRSRNLVRVLSCAVALDMLRRTLLNQEPIVPYPSIPASKTI